MGLIITSNTENYGPFSSADEKENCKKYWWAAFAINFSDPRRKVRHEASCSVYSRV